MNDYRRAVLLEDGKGNEVIVLQSGHQPISELEYSKVAQEIRETNDETTIDEVMMGNVDEGIVKVLHHDKPRCCKSEKLK